MDENGSATAYATDVADAPEGTRVVGADGAKLGEVVAVYRDRLIVERGFFFPTDYYVPFDAVAAYERGTIYLALPRDEALNQGWQTPPVDEVLPDVAAPAPAPAAAPRPGPPVRSKAPSAEPAPVAAKPSPDASPVAPAVGTVAPPVVPPAPPAERPVTEAAPADRAVPSAPAASPVDRQGPTVEADPSATEAETTEPITEAPATPTIEPTPPPSPVAAPFAATPTLTTERGSTLSRLFPDLVTAPADDEPEEPAAAQSAVSSSDAGAVPTADVAPAPDSSTSDGGAPAPSESAPDPAGSTDEDRKTE
jgi:hypothetical protein